MVERQEPLVLEEAQLLKELPSQPKRLSALGSPLDRASADALCRAFDAAAVPRRMQPYRLLGSALGGVVFVCGPQTLAECISRSLFGMMQDTFVPIVQHIRPGLPVSLLFGTLKHMIIMDRVILDLSVSNIHSFAIIK